MTRREIWLIALVVLLLGLIGGFLIGSAVSDDDDAEVGDTPPTTETPPPTTETAPPSTTETAPPTTETAPPSTVAPTVPPTTAPPEPPPLADAVTGAVLGIPMGSELDGVIAAMNARYGEPTADFGWTTGCPLDGDESLDERTIRWGNFILRGWKDDAMAVLDGWRYFRGAAGEFDITGPLPEELVFHDGVAWNMTIGDVAAALGTELTTLEEFGFAGTYVDEFAEYRGVDTSPDSFFSYVGYRAGDLCD